MSDSQAYAGSGAIDAAANEYSRTDFIVRRIMAGMATAAIVKVVKASGLTVDVQPMVNQLDGSGNGVAHGVIHNLPVMRLQGGACAVIVDPVANDMGIAVFAHSDISSVKATKAQGNPGSRRKFDWADGVYMGGILNAAPTTFLRMLPSGEVTITATGPIRLNASGVINLTAPTAMVTGDFSVSGAASIGNGKTGAVTAGGHTLTFVNGILTGYV